MSLATLKNKEPREILRLLSAVSTSLLPNPSVDEPTYQSGINTELVDSLINEIRQRLNIPNNDYSISAQSKIFDFLSNEISNITLTDANLTKVKNRLGGKGELALNQYKIEFMDIFKSSEALGEKKSNIIDTISNPHKFSHYHSKYIKDKEPFGFTLLTKLITPKRDEDKFIQIVLSGRQGDTLLVMGVLRAYLSEINLNQIAEPLDILKAFVDTYGLTFKLGNITSKFIQNEVTELENKSAGFQIKVLNGKRGDDYLPVFIGDESGISASGGGMYNISEILLAFAFDISKYTATLARHNVHLSREDWRFPKI